MAILSASRGIGCNALCVDVDIYRYSEDNELYIDCEGVLPWVEWNGKIHQQRRQRTRRLVYYVTFG
jgi:hypothetical protein